MQKEKEKEKSETMLNSKIKEEVLTKCLKGQIQTDDLYRLEQT